MAGDHESGRRAAPHGRVVPRPARRALRPKDMAGGSRWLAMPTIYVDSALSDEKRRHRLYSGDLFAFSAGESATKLAELARELSQAAFAPHDPQVAQESMPA